jgi:glutamate synthase domain-containing protein 3
LTGDLEGDQARRRAIKVLTLLTDRRYLCGEMRRSSILSLVDTSLADVFEAVRKNPTPGFAFHSRKQDAGEPRSDAQAVVVEARDYDPEGPEALSREIVRLVERGFRQVLIAHARGHRFIGNGLGPESEDIRLEVFGSSGDYLGSGIDGAHITVHGTGQDQLAQIMKRGRLVVHGDVGQTFMYAAKGGQAYVLGNAAGRPLINAVGRPRVVINGTCLDYLAESFMAGDPLNDGGFVILNGVAFDEHGELRTLDTPYPGGNLFSLASGGAIFLRDPFCKVGEDQLNGGEFGEFGPQHWALIRPLLEENQRLFGIPIAWLLKVDGESRRPEDVYRVIVAARHKALQPEEVWVAHSNKT